ncbi:hypothetical protein [Aestuariibius sp. HNIBRBA575]|uniref:hypothetical protein n=1 Tax=Aestuariibius sp. HNIBRBA575 TaxID=3233343 RepID=UPI0034A2CB8B
MPGFLEIDPIVAAFFGYKQLLYLELIAVLALIRIIVTRNHARRMAMAAFLFCAAIIAGKYVPVLLGTFDGLFVIITGQIRNYAGGMAALLLASALLLGSGILTGRRWWGIDLLHGILLSALLGLWGYSLI